MQVKTHLDIYLVVSTLNKVSACYLMCFLAIHMQSHAMYVLWEVEAEKPMIAHLKRMNVIIVRVTPER